MCGLLDNRTVQDFIQTHHNSLPPVEQGINRPSQEASTANSLHLSHSRADEVCATDELFTNSNELEGWEREYEAWLDRVELESRIKRGLL